MEIVCNSISGTNCGMKKTTTQDKNRQMGI